MMNDEERQVFEHCARVDALMRFLKEQDWTVAETLTILGDVIARLLHSVNRAAFDKYLLALTQYWESYKKELS